MKIFPKETQEPIWVDPGNFLQDVPNEDILQAYDRMALNFRKHEYAMERWSYGGRSSPAWRALLKIQKDKLMSYLMEHRFCDENIERNPHSHEFNRLAREQKKAEEARGMLKRPIVRRQGVYREVSLSDSDSDPDPDSYCEPENGYCAFVESPMCYICSHYKREKRETIINLGIGTETTLPKEMKKETKPEIKDAIVL